MSDLIDFNGKLMANQPLDGSQLAAFGRSAKCNCCPLTPCSTSPPDPMYIGFGLAGKVIIHNVSDAFNVNTAGGDICCDQYRDLRIAKVGECPRKPTPATAALRVSPSTEE